MNYFNCCCDPPEPPLEPCFTEPWFYDFTTGPIDERWVANCVNQFPYPDGVVEIAGGKLKIKEFVGVDSGFAQYSVSSCTQEGFDGVFDHWITAKIGTEGTPVGNVFQGLSLLLSGSFTVIFSIYRRFSSGSLDGLFLHGTSLSSFVSSPNIPDGSTLAIQTTGEDWTANTIDLWVFDDEDTDIYNHSVEAEYLPWDFFLAQQTMIGTAALVPSPNTSFVLTYDDFEGYWV